MSDTPSPQSDQSGMLAYGVRRPIGMLMVVLAAVVFGAVSLSKLPVDLLPAIDYPSLTVRTLYPGAAPEDVEERVTEKLEDLLSTVSNLVRMRSSSRAEVSEILMEFEWGSNLPFLVQDVRERIDRVFLSQGVERPLILRYDPSLDPVLRIAVSGGNDLVRLRDLAEQEIERELEGQPGVASVRVRGGLEDEIQVRVDPQRLASFQIDSDLIRQRLAEENLNVPGGTLEEGATEYVVRTLNEFRTLDQIRDLPILKRNDATILLRDLGRVVRTHKDRDVVLRVGGDEAVEVQIYREAGANIVEVADKVKAKLFPPPTPQRSAEHDGVGNKRPPSVQEKLPKDIRLTLLSDQSQFVSGAISEVRSAAAVGGILAVLVCFLFLRRFAVTLIIGLSVPISVIASFGAMYGAGVTLNVMSLGGLALGIGMLVDNTIVVLESITRCREEGDSPMQAAVRGVREVGGAVTASTLTTIAVFAPIIFVEGVAGQTFGDQALTVVSSLLISLAVALFFIPGLAARTRLGVAGDQKRIGFGDQLRGQFQNIRSRHGLRRPRWWMLLLGLLGLAAGMYLLQQSKAVIAPWAEELARYQRNGSQGLSPVPEQVTQRAAMFSFAGIVALVPFLWSWGELLLQWAVMLIGDLFALLMLGSKMVLGLLLAAFHVIMLPFGWAVSATVGLLQRLYPQVLKGALRAPLVVLLIVVLAAWQTAQTAGSLGRELLPEVLQGEITAELFFPAGYPLEKTDQLALALEQDIRALPWVVESAVASGADRDSISTEEEGPHTSRILVRTEAGDGAREKEAEVEAGIRHLLDREPALARFNLRRPTLLALNAPVEIELIGDDLAALERTARQVEHRLRAVEGIADLRTSLRRGNPEVRITLDRDQLARHNLTVAQVASRLRLAVEGEVSSTFPGQDERIDIRVRADPETMNRVDQLPDLPVNPGAERPLTLAAVADMEIADGPSEIRHIGGRRAAVLTASLAGFDLGATADAIRSALNELPPDDTTVVRLGGQTTEMDSALDSLSFALLLAVFLVYAVMAAQFESLLQPLLIMFSVPLAAVGAVYALMLTSTPISIVALLGAVVLAGIVVNNAIVLVDRINRNRASGMKVEEAILEAGNARLRPILMTTVTTVLGMIPLTGWLVGLPGLGSIGAAEGTELRAPMALVVISGLITSTLLTLVVIPTGYRVLARLQGDD